MFLIVTKVVLWADIAARLAKRRTATRPLGRELDQLCPAALGSPVVRTSVVQNHMSSRVHDSSPAPLPEALVGGLGASCQDLGAEARGPTSEVLQHFKLYRGCPPTRNPSGSLFFR